MFQSRIFAILLFATLFCYGRLQDDDDINKSYMKMVLKNLNTSVNPCDDFYQYACGNWAKNYVSDDYVDMPGYIEHLVNEQFLAVLMGSRTKVGIYDKLWQYYRSCENLKNPALNYYLKLIEHDLGFQWPIFRENWNKTWSNETNFDWLSTIAHLRLYGLNGVFLTQNINVRLTNGSHYLVEVHQHQPQSQLNLDNIASIFVNFGMSERDGRNVSIKIIELEKRLNNLTNLDLVIESEADEMRFRKSFKEMSIEELAKMAPKIDWSKYFSIILGRAIKPKTETIQTFSLNPKYFQQLSEVLQESSNETICHYVMLQFMYFLNDFLPSTTGNSSLFCIKHLRGHMPLAMNYLYEEHYYKAKRMASDAALHKLFDKLRQTFELIVAENYLTLDFDEQLFILDELRTMQMKIGNIPTNVSRQFVDDFYRTIKMDSSNFYKNHLQLIKLNIRHEQEKLRNRPIPSAMHFYEHDTETASSSSPVKIFDNAILVPYGFLQLPLFDAKLSPILQYSLFGFIIAHEIIHAYDLFHIVYDKHGNYNDMGVSVAHHFWKYVDCFARHPSDNLSENIADVAGLRLVFKAYFDDIAANSLHQHDENGLPPFLPSSSAAAIVAAPPTNLTSEQLFFINSVQFLCANMEKISSLNARTLNLEHDMHDERVRRNWANFEQFAAAFNCPNDATMNPIVKCRLW